ncbi:MAG: hypothetical protein JNJ88_19485 [Planctomycetes bacterium]|nr:hypothetical protein [Planctomycetota bacterium]
MPNLTPLLLLSLLSFSNEPALTGLDPVALCEGREVAGVESHSRTRGEYTYRFADGRTAARFDAEPERYEIQMGGGCGRMGPLAGKGDPARFWVFDGKIYIFASEQCRTAFQKDPLKFLEPEDPAPAAGDEARSRGGALLEKVLAAFGGAEKVDGLKTLQVSRVKRTARTGADSKPASETVEKWKLTVAFPGSFRIDQSWDDWDSFRVMIKEKGGDGGDAFFVGETTPAEVLHPTARREMWRDLLRQPLVLLRFRREPGFLAVAGEKRAVAGVEAEELKIHYSGTTTTLSVDAAGRIVALEYRGRGPQFWFGAVEHRFSDFVEVGGLKLPRRRALVFDGKEPSGEAPSYEIQVNDPVPSGLFQRN